MNLKNKRIIFVLGEFSLGGAERQALLLARMFQQKCGAHVEIWSLHPQAGRVSELCDQFGLPWHTLPLQWNPSKPALLKDLARLAWALRRARPDVLMPYITFQNVACGLIWRLTGAKLCVWNQREEGLIRLGASAENAAVARTPLFIANSRGGAEFLTRDLKAPAAKVHTVYNGVELAPPARGRDQWRRELDLAPGDFAACMVANFNGYKDHLGLLRAWKRAVASYSHGERAVLLFAGRTDGSYAEPYQAARELCEQLDLNDHVRFMGGVSDISGLLGAVELGAFCSHSEGVPNGVLECMASGLAMVGSDIPGVREAVGENYQFLSPPGDDETLAATIIQMQRDPELRARLGKANKTRIETAFSPETLLARSTELIARYLPQTQK